MKTDVLVVGAGPVGLTLAADLARYGCSVRVVEKAAQRTDKSKALVLWSRTLELMDRMNCSANFIAAGMKVTAAHITTGHQSIAHITLTGVATPHPYALMLPQSDTERLLEAHLASLGVKVEREVELKAFSEQNDGVTATLQHAAGREESVEASWLVGCDGAHSTVRHQLGMEFEGNTLQSDWILADIHLSRVPYPDNIHVIWHAAGVLVLFPISPGRFRIVADVGIAGPERRPDPTLAEVQATLDERGPGGILASDPIWLAAFRINERKVANYRSGRIFLAGDAAHIHSPAGGQGMNTGMQDAWNLAWKLALVCRDQCAESILDSYTPERSAVGDLVLKGAGRLTQIATLRGRIRQSVRNHLATRLFGLNAVRSRVAQAVSEVSIGYPKSPLTEVGSPALGGPRAGERAPIREGETPIGSGDSPRFVICSAPTSDTAKLLLAFPHLLEYTLRPPFHPGGFWLVRPDGYIAVAAPEADASRAFTFLQQLVK